MNARSLLHGTWRWFGGAILVLLLVYWPTLQTIPNGSSHYYMIDVGETQIVLNNWGTLHPTGYPLYVVTGNVLVALMRIASVDAVVAPALVSTLWGIVALALVFALGHHLTQRAWLAALAVLVFGLVRSVWIHFVIAEIYTFGLAIVMALLCLGLWRDQITGRIYWMALLGGIGIAHHRATAMLIPALLVAVWPQLAAQRKHLPRLMFFSLLLGLLGFVQYLYLYLRGQSAFEWVYGEPGTLAGLWDQFIGTEASRFIGPADSFEALLENIALVNNVLITDLTLPGLLLGIVGLVLTITQPQQRHPAVVFTLVAAASYAFHALLYSDVLSALILQIEIGLLFGWVLLADEALRWQPLPISQRTAAALLAALAVGFAGLLFVRNQPFINDLTHDPTGLQTIEQVRAAPPGSTVMLAWGPRYFAASFAQDIQDDLPSIELVDHKADFTRIVASGSLLTPAYTRFNQPPEWWSQRLGQPVYPQAAAPGLVAINVEPDVNPNADPGLSVAEAQLVCESAALRLDLTWQTDTVPQADLSVFVHALRGDNPVPVAQADSFAPVYGWRPLTTWLPDEQVRDIYTIPVDPATVDKVRFGLYRVIGDNQFENVLEREIAVECDDE